jgi:hypothetical protein
MNNRLDSMLEEDIILKKVNSTIMKGINQILYEYKTKQLNLELEMNASLQYQCVNL